MHKPLEGIVGGIRDYLGSIKKYTQEKALPYILAVPILALAQGCATYHDYWNKHEVNVNGVVFKGENNKNKLTPEQKEIWDKWCVPKEESPLYQSLTNAGVPKEKAYELYKDFCEKYNFDKTATRMCRLLKEGHDKFIEELKKDGYSTDIDHRLSVWNIIMFVPTAGLSVPIEQYLPAPNYVKKGLEVLFPIGGYFGVAAATGNWPWDDGGSGGGPAATTTPAATTPPSGGGGFGGGGGIPGGDL